MSAAKSDSAAVISRRARRLQDGPGARGDDREARLLEVGERLLTEGTFNETSISTIAGEAGLSRPGFYFYFASKDELLAALVQHVLAEALASWSVMLEEPAESPDQLADLVRCLVRDSAKLLWQEHQQMMCAVVELVPRVPLIREQWRRGVTNSGETLAKLMISQTQVPELRDPRRALVTSESLVWMFERSFYFLTVDGCHADDVDELAATIAEAWIGAMGVLPGIHSR